MALGLGGKFFVGQHDAAVGQVDHDQASAFVVAEVEEDLAVVEAGAGAREVRQFSAQFLAGFLAIKNSLDDAGGRHAVGAVKAPIGRAGFRSRGCSRRS
jgi:hypothetical protein